MIIPKGFILRDEGGNPVFELLRAIKAHGHLLSEDVKSLNGEPIIQNTQLTAAQDYAREHATEQYLASLTNQ